MSREIKFRAYDAVNKQWLPEGWYVKLPDITLNFGPQMHLMQYTGLKDKNGVEIYEGDLLKMSIDEKGQDIRAVEFEEGCFWLGDKPAYEWPLQFIEIIGNIYENRELLEAKQ